MASIEAWGGPSGNSFPLIQTVSAGAAPESLARCANAASVRPAAIIPANARPANSRRETICAPLCLIFSEIPYSNFSCSTRRGKHGRADRPWIHAHRTAERCGLSCRQGYHTWFPDEEGLRGDREGITSRAV